LTNVEIAVTGLSFDRTPNSMERKDSGYMSTNEMAEQTKARKEKPLNEYIPALL
jgi:hypothetical protein